MKRAVYPGSFDPVTTGHLGIIRRAAGLFDELTVLIMKNVSKKGMFDYEERRLLMEDAVAGLGNVKVDVDTGLLSEYVMDNGIQAIVKGLRGERDFQYEMEMAQINRRLAPGTETVFLLSDPQDTMVSSSNVRELIAYGADLDGFVPESVRPRLKKLMMEKRR